MASGSKWGRKKAGTAGVRAQEPVVISSPEELIASVPSLLGFPPAEGSMVVMCGRMADGGQSPVMRLDVEELVGEAVSEPECGVDAFDEFDDGPDELFEPVLSRSTSPLRYGAAQGVAEFCSREGIREVHLVVVHEDCADDYAAGMRAQDAAAAFEYWLSLTGTDVLGAFGVGGFAPGAPWVDLFGMVQGVQIDPDTTHLAAVRAFDGRVRASSRAEIDEVFRARDEHACDHDEAGSDVCPEDLVAMREGAPGPRGTLDFDDAVSRAVEIHDDVARRMGAGEGIDDDDVAFAGRVLRVIPVRDAVYRDLALRDLVDDDGRRGLWWAIARRRPARERSVALLLLGAAEYFAGNGVHAWSAFDAALEADPGNSFARLLIQGLGQGVAPDRLRRVAQTA